LADSRLEASGGAKAPAAIDVERARPPREVFDATLATRTVGVSPSPEAPEVLPPGTRIGRYILIEHIGSGATGAVHRAFDPDLNRPIALKLMATCATSTEPEAEAERARVLREAQALARLSHPNVVTIHDVGIESSFVFLAMELVEGETLRTWIRRHRGDRDTRSVQAKLARFIAAGEGLAAAHQAGLVHADFKPANVLLGKDEDDRVVVADFGLARLTPSASNDSATDPPPAVANVVAPPAAKVPDSNDEEISQPLPTLGLLSALDGTQRFGVIAGTPAYMAAEQHRGDPATPASDQFAFCVALHEAVMGTRPFEGEDVDSVTGNVCAGRLRMGHNPAVPKRVRAAIERGLSTDAKDRFPSMVELLEQLRPSTKNRTLLAMTLAAFAAVVLTAWLVRAGAPAAEQDRCANAEQQFSGAWTAADRSALKDAFAATGTAYATESFTRVDKALDDYEAEWKGKYERTCRATFVEGRQSDQLLDLRMRCLARSRDRMSAIVQRLTEGGEPTLYQGAINTVLVSSSLQHCDDEGLLTRAVPLPEDPDLRASVERIQTALTKLDVIDTLGEGQQSLDRARELRRQAEALDYPPIQIETRFYVAIFNDRRGEWQKAEPLLLDVVRDAADVGDQTLVARALINLIRISGQHRTVPFEQLRLTHEAASASVTLAGDPANLRMALLRETGVAAFNDAQWDAALELFTNYRDVATPLGNAGRNQVALALMNLGILHYELGRYDKAISDLSGSLDQTRELVGERHPDVVLGRHNLGHVLLRTGRVEQAREPLQRALESARGDLPPEHWLIPLSEGAMAEFWFHVEDMEAARRAALRGAEHFERVTEKGHRWRAWAGQLRGLAALTQGRYDEAIGHLEPAARLYQSLVGDEHEDVGFTLSLLGRAQLAAGQVDDARESLRRALELLDIDDAQAKVVRADEARFALAQVEWRRGERATALAMAREVRDRFAALAPFKPAALAAMDAWLASRAP